MKIDWKRKLISHKLWFAVAGFVTGLILAFNGSAEVAESVSGCITAGDFGIFGGGNYDFYKYIKMRKNGICI